MTFMEMLEQGAKVPEMDIQGYLVVTPHMCRELLPQFQDLVDKAKKWDELQGHVKSMMRE